MARDGGRGRGDRSRWGSRNTDPYAEGSGGSEPVDIVAVRHDDELIDAIAAGSPIAAASSEERQLAALLADWRAEIVSEPLSAKPDLDTVVAAVNQEIGARQARISAQSGGRLRLLRPIATTAAALALVFGGLSAFSYQAEPGDALWRIKEVVFSEQAQSTVVQYADDNLAAAEQLLAQGDPEQARARLEQASTNATAVSDPVKRNELVQRWQQVLEQMRKDFPQVAEQLQQATPEPDPRAPVQPQKPGDPTKPGQSGRPTGTITSTPGGGMELDSNPTGSVTIVPGGPGNPGSPDNSASVTPSNPTGTPDSTTTTTPAQPTVSLPTLPLPPVDTPTADPPAPDSLPDSGGTISSSVPLPEIPTQQIPPTTLPPTGGVN